LFDIEALQLMLKDLRAENDLLLNSKSGSVYDYNPKNERPKSVSHSHSFVGDLSAFDNRNDLKQFNKSPGIGRKDPNRESQPEPKHGRRSTMDPNRESKQSYLPSSPLIQKTNNNEINDYFEQKERLDFELNFLTQEKQKLTFELSRVPSSGGKALQKQDELEGQLDVIDHRMATLRKQMREYNIL
jgi:chaperonin cofactor prefoldin